MNLQGVVAIFAAFLIGLALLVPRGWSRRVGIMCIICSLAAASFFYVRDRRISLRDEKINLGDPQTRVLALLGSPTQTTDCSTGYGGYKRGDLEKKRLRPIVLRNSGTIPFIFRSRSLTASTATRKLFGSTCSRLPKIDI
jgi:hypothetical protein